MNLSKSQLNEGLDTPVLFLIFNRPELTRKVFEQIRKAEPTQLFIAADGPRDAYPDDNLKCQETRNLVIDMIDWDCNVNTLFRDNNLGCGLSVSQAISWFFDNVEMGIILEDDCLPSLSFFDFCRQLLNYYKNDNEVMHISGGSYIPSKYFGNESYYFSKYPYVWGWATWKRSWSLFNFDITGLQQYVDQAHTDQIERNYWHEIYFAIQEKKIDTWAWRWNFILWKHKGIAVNSSKNRIKNIGFDDSSTHTRSAPWMYDRIPLVEEMNTKIIHASKKETYKKADRLVFQYYNLRKIPLGHKLKNSIYGRFQSVFMGKK